MLKILFLVVFFTIECVAQRTGWWIFRRPQSTRPKPVIAVAAVRGDLSGVFYNPSLLGTLREREIFLLTEFGFARDIFGGILYGQPIGKKAGISAGVVYYDAGRTTLYWIEAGRETPKTVTIQRDLLGLISYGWKLTDRFLAGATFKLANSNIAEARSAFAYGIDLGILFLVTDRLNLSLAGQNLGFSTRFVGKAEALPTSVWLGGSYTLHVSRISYLSFGVDLPYIVIENRLTPGLGIEYFYGRFGVNLGYRLGAEEAVLQAGFVVTLKNIDLGYAFVPARFLAHTHRLTIGFRF